jgi:hypothetical protein
MTEAEWQGCADPVSLLAFLEGKVSERKLRLFACACCRRVERFLVDRRSRQLIEVSELFADGRSTAHRLQSAWEKADEAEQAIRLDVAAVACPPASAKRTSAQAVLHLGVDLGLFEAILLTVETMGEAARETWGEAADLAGAAAEEAAQAALLRDLIGDPFRPVRVAPEWLAWSDGAVRKVAAGIYDERAFERMGILGDALEEAGCCDEVILGHCRDQGDHALGCWLLDLILVKDQGNR